MTEGSEGSGTDLVDEVIVPVLPSDFPARFASGGFAPAVILDGLVFCSGMVGFAEDGSIPSDFVTQVDNTFRNLQRILEAAGASFGDVVSLTSYHVGSIEGQMSAVQAIKDRYCGPSYCAWTAVGVSALAVREALIEIQAIARRRRSVHRA